MRASLLIAAFQEGDRLWKTVHSCVESCTDLDYEIILADDGSSDRSVDEAARRFPEVRVVRHEGREGASPTRALAARQARGDVLVFLDGHTKPELGALARLVEDVEQLDGQAIVTPQISALQVDRWRNDFAQAGHGLSLKLDTFESGWLGLHEMRAVDVGRRRLYESPAMMGCALAVARELYDRLRGFDPHMKLWGAEDLDLALKCWLMGHRVLHDPEAAVGHRFRRSFDNYTVPIQHLVVNQLRMARKNFTRATFNEWVERCRAHHAGKLPDHPEGLWARIWLMFEADRASVETERSYLHARRLFDEFWYAERFGLAWPALQGPTLVTVPSAAPTGKDVAPAAPAAQDAAAERVAAAAPGGAKENRVTRSRPASFQQFFVEFVKFEQFIHEQFLVKQLQLFK